MASQLSASSPTRARSPGAGSVDDLAAVFRGEGGEAVTPLLQSLRGEAHPVGDLLDHAEGCGAAVGAGRVAGELLVGDVGVVFVGPGGIDEVNPGVRSSGASSAASSAARPAPSRSAVK